MKNRRRSFLVSASAEDKISNLSEHIINSILERLPIQDAVRTSILSKEWRYKWTTMRVLVFDDQFFTKFAKNGAFGRNGFIRIINKLITLHEGLISKFSLHVPHMSRDGFQEIDQWILILSRKSITELVLTYSNQRYQLPSYVFSCLELRKLELTTCIFKPPPESKGFLNLEDLFLSNIDFITSSCGNLVTLPQLKVLRLYLCKNVYNFNIRAMKLTQLLVIHCPDALLLRLLNVPCLVLVAISFAQPIKDFARVEKMNLVKLMSNMPNTVSFLINGHFLKFLSTDKFPKYLRHAFNSLHHLHLLDFQLADLDQLNGVLCLLHNSPNLETLLLMHAQPEPQVIHYDVGPASNHLESLDCWDHTLNQLQTIKMTTFGGSRLELLFIKLLLAHSPSLKKMSIEPRKSFDLHKRLDIAKDFMRFSRASTKADVIYLDSKP